MFKRVMAVLLSLPILMIPSHAWSYQSFIGADWSEPLSSHEYYEFGAVANSYSLMTADVAAVSDSNTLSNWGHSVDNIRAYVTQQVYYPGVSAGTVTIPGYWIPRTGTAVEILNSGYTSSAWGNVGLMYSQPVTVPGLSSDDTYTRFEDPAVNFNSTITTFSIPVDGNSTAVSLTGHLYYTLAYGGVLGLFSVVPTACTLYINGVAVRSFLVDEKYRGDSDFGYVDFGGYVYSGTRVITSMELRFLTPSASFKVAMDSNGEIPDVQTFVYSRFDTTSLDISFLSEDLGKPTGMDSADSALNDYQQQEGQYFGDANTNIGGLDTTIAGDLYSAAELLGGLFNDIWNTIGGVKLIYFSPLLFGFFLWVAGKVRR